MKILHIVRQFHPCIGGVENFVFCLAREQLKAGNAVSVLTLNKNFSNKAIFSNEEIYEGIKIRRIPFWGSRRYPISFSSIRYLDNYDIVNIHCVDFFVDYLVLLKFMHRKKIILNTHGGFFHTKWLSPLKKLYFNIVTRLVLSGCDRIIANSKNDFELFSRITDNLVRIDNGVEVEKFGAIEKNIEKNSIIYVGRLDEHKRVDNLINVTSKLINKGYEVKLKVIGPDWKGIKPQLETQIARLGIKDSVVFLGQLTEEGLLQEISKAHIFVSASEYEAFGISAIEAMASGTPCVLNNIDSFREFLKDPDCGLLTDFNDCEKAANDIGLLLKFDDNKYARMGNKAKELAKQYSWDSVAKKITAVYEEVL